MPVVGFSGVPVVKNLPANAGDLCSIPGLGRSPGEGNGNPLLYPCLGNPMDRGAWRALGSLTVRHNLATTMCQCQSTVSRGGWLSLVWRLWLWRWVGREQTVQMESFATASLTQSIQRKLFDFPLMLPVWRSQTQWHQSVVGTQLLFVLWIWNIWLVNNFLRFGWWITGSCLYK